MPPRARFAGPCAKFSAITARPPSSDFRRHDAGCATADRRGSAGGLQRFMSFFQFEARFFRGLLDRVGVRPRRLLVVGCGPGEEMAMLARETGAVAFGIDISVDRRSRAPGVHLV